MKKVALVALLAILASSVNAAELGVNGSYNTSTGSSANAVGVTLGQHFGKYSVEAEFDRNFKDNTNDVSLTGGYDLFKVGGVTVTPKIGVAHVSPANSIGGNAVLLGVEASIPVTKQVSASVKVNRRFTENRISESRGNTVAVGAKYAF